MNFAYERETEVYGSCGATLNGEMFVLGGKNQRRQVNIKNIPKPGHFFVKLITGYPQYF